MKEVVVKGKTYKVEVIVRRNNRKTYMRIKNGVIVFSGPTKLTEKTIIGYIENNLEIVEKYINKTPKTLSSEYIHYLGVKYNLVLIPSKNDLVYINGADLIVEYTKESKISININKFYKETVEFIINQNKEEIFKKFNIKNTEIVYKNVKTFFGKCYTTQNKISLNIRLAKYDIKYILSVLYHECAHFKVPNHSSKYYQYLESIYPNYRQVQKELRSIKYNEKY